MTHLITLVAAKIVAQGRDGGRMGGDIGGRGERELRAGTGRHREIDTGL